MIMMELVEGVIVMEFSNTGPMRVGLATKDINIRSPYVDASNLSVKDYERVNHHIGWQSKAAELLESLLY